MFSRTAGLIISAFISLVTGLTGCSRTAEVTEPTTITAYGTPIAISCASMPGELGIISELPGMIRLIGYTGNDFVTGTVQVSNLDWIPVTELTGDKVSLVQTAKLKVADSQNLTNLWKLRVGDSQPFRLEIRNAEAEGHWNFSGLPITNLYAELGTGNNAFTFDEVNPDIMQKCELFCSTGDIVVEGILNAACRDMFVVAGEGNLTLRFGGKELLQDLHVSIRAGTGTMYIYALPEIPTHITITGGGQIIQGEGVTRFDADDGSSIYETDSCRDILSRKIEISISGGSGTIHLNSP